MNRHLDSQRSLPQTLIFIHIPKAAGTTLYQVLHRQYKVRHTLYIHSPDTERSIDTFRELSERRKVDLRCICGHMPFGLYRWLPQPATYITILRNPIKRIVSEYYFLRRKPHQPEHSELVEKNLSLEEFYIRNMVGNNVTNLQTRWIAGSVDFDSVMPPYENLPANALELAKENIKNHFSVCGLTERFDESLLLMQEIHRWKNVYYMRRNVAKQRPSEEQSPASTRRLIEKYEEKDLALYEFAAGRLTEMLDAYGIGAEQVRRFRTRNRFLGGPMWIFGALPTKLLMKIRGHTTLKL